MKVNYFLPPQAPHFALQAPHFCMEFCALHLRPAQAPHIMAQPLSAAAVTTADARALESVEDKVVIICPVKLVGYT
ncbi:hypothetical protein H3H36_02405 [Duganella sp. FT3S]|uniref:Uncharacterized protein n=1 Tax=Rugamonas fusca TaxID=2758568 RepID=A0A7W2EE13_9BURK|nr:hypothetical protein [Rugamonas fusca]MBA5604215.1 hypothetical protein [Rugamonas fusca]